MRLNHSKHVLLIFIIAIALLLYAVNTYFNEGIAAYSFNIPFFSTVSFILTLILLGSYQIKRSRRWYNLTLAVASVLIVLNIILSAELITLEYHRKKQTQLNKIDTCQKAEAAFHRDLDAGELKYFTFGLGEDIELTDSLKKNNYPLEVYAMGCLADNSLLCYNELVERHFGLVYPQPDRGKAVPQL